MEELTLRQKFCLEQREIYPFKSAWCSSVPDFVEAEIGSHIAKDVLFAPHGFGYEKINGEWLLISHAGKIVIEDKVSIGEGTVIVRATHKDGQTIIRKGTKIDTLCHIAHNVDVGENCLIVSGVVIGGSVQVGNDVYIGMGAMIKNKIKIGDGATVGMGAVVIRDVLPGETVIGNPARPLIKK